MRKPETRRLLQMLALTLVVLSHSGYFLLWLGIRTWGEITLTFGTFGPAWLLWFERWAEGAVILGGIGFLTYFFWQEFHRRERPSNP